MSLIIIRTLIVVWSYHLSTTHSSSSDSSDYDCESQSTSSSSSDDADHSTCDDINNCLECITNTNTNTPQCIVCESGYFIFNGICYEYNTDTTLTFPCDIDTNDDDQDSSSSSDRRRLLQRRLSGSNNNINNLPDDCQCPQYYTPTLYIPECDIYQCQLFQNVTDTCEQDNGIDNCDLCIGSQCLVCQDDYFILPDNTGHFYSGFNQCAQCQQEFGFACTKCGNNFGCVECISDWKRIFDDETGLYYCECEQNCPDIIDFEDAIDAGFIPIETNVIFRIPDGYNGLKWNVDDTTLILNTSRDFVQELSPNIVANLDILGSFILFNGQSMTITIGEIGDGTTFEIVSFDALGNWDRPDPNFLTCVGFLNNEIVFTVELLLDYNVLQTVYFKELYIIEQFHCSTTLSILGQVVMDNINIYIYD